MPSRLPTADSRLPAPVNNHYIIVILSKLAQMGITEVDSMGRIRPTYIKRVAIELLKKYPQEFSPEFEHNKLKVGELTDCKYNGMRNRIAGYVTCYRKRHLPT